LGQPKGLSQGQESSGCAAAALGFPAQKSREILAAEPPSANAGAHPQPQHAGSQDNGNGKLVLLQLNRLHEAFKLSQIPFSACSSSQDQQPPFPRNAVSRSN
jgi:hypothetical protein